ncbi:NADP-dependent oxidoreductase [Flavobacterium cupreum]|uniref:NADP-dependent oxidoreductase n=1 Tax=Flavobacterium cupreum TaxID=2133766 RepID=A0A434ADJ9_9FLAO|nr:NADP-dependent oxidoreductase [Flavobacterium cupreum]RUT72440.1 NADP-dependent oxidoreductase [Flavobacterium cupreum]
MKAIFLKTPGAVENFIYKEVPQPSITADEVLVKVESISINPIDIKTRKGLGVYIYANLDPAKEYILGWDISGIVIQSNSPLFIAGDEVFGMVNFPGLGAAYAEFVAAPAAHLAKKPAGISHPQAAGATLAALTAWQNLVNRAHIKSGDRVSIHAAAGGVGHFAVQIAKHFGAYVIGTSSAANKDFVLSVGADEHIDYKTQTLSESVENVDFVLECLDNQSILNSLQVIRPGGSLISILTNISPEVQVQADAMSIQTAYTSVTSNGADMKHIAELLSSGAIKSHISKEFSFDQMAEAHNQIESGRTVGKVIVNL